MISFLERVDSTSLGNLLFYDTWNFKDRFAGIKVSFITESMWIFYEFLKVSFSIM